MMPVKGVFLSSFGNTEGTTAIRNTRPYCFFEPLIVMHGVSARKAFHNRIDKVNIGF